MPAQETQNPVLDVLTCNSFSELATALRVQTANVVPSWESMVREALPSADSLTLAQLRNRIPDILAQLVEVLESTTAVKMNELIDSTGQHGAIRFQQGFKLDEVLIEYRLLRRVLIEQAEQALNRRTTVQEDIALNMGIDTILHHGITSFFSHYQGRPQDEAVATHKAISTLSHDLRNNVSSAMLNLELVRRRLARSQEFTDELSELKVTRQSLATTIEGIEKLARVAQGRDAPT
jgi:hypothetical protein